MDWTAITHELDRSGAAIAPALLAPDDCDRIAAMYTCDTAFRSTVVMARHGFGRGEYRYFAYPLPDPLHTLRHGSTSAAVS